MKDTLLYVLFISAIVALFGFAFSFSQEPTPDGKQIFLDNKCNKCHSVTSMDITSSKDDAVDLSNTGSVGDVQLLKSYLLKDSTIEDKSHKIKFKGSEEELNILAEWLNTLKTETAK